MLDAKYFSQTIQKNINKHNLKQRIVNLLVLNLLYLGNFSANLEIQLRISLPSEKTKTVNKKSRIN